MRLAIFISCLAAFVSVSAFGAEPCNFLCIDQPAPDSHTFITATIWSAVCRDPYGATVTIKGSTVVITPKYWKGPCLGGGMPLRSKVFIGLLPGGVYDVAGIDLDPHGGDIHAKLVVRGIDPVAVYPPGGPIAGGTPITLDFGTSYYQPSEIFFDGKSLGKCGVGCVAPPHAAGDVDVTVVARDIVSNVSSTYVMPSAFRYFDPVAEPDPFLFEPVLFPITSESEGAFGSRWTTDSSIGAGVLGPSIYFTEFWKPPCEKCPARISPWEPPPYTPVRVFSLDKRTSAAGTLLHAFRGTTDAMVASSRVRAVGAKNAGVQIPIVRERDFRPMVAIVDIPVRRDSRAMLRVWSLQQPVGPVYGRISLQQPMDTNRIYPIMLTLSPASPDGLPFASRDLSPELSQVPEGSVLSMTIGGVPWPNIWAMVSITNNETQEVTILTPHR